MTTATFSPSVLVCQLHSLDRVVSRVLEAVNLFSVCVDDLCFAVIVDADHGFAIARPGRHPTYNLLCLPVLLHVYIFMSVHVGLPLMKRNKWR